MLKELYSLTQNANQEYCKEGMSKFLIGTFAYLDNKTTSITKCFDTQITYTYILNKSFAVSELVL